MRSVDVAVVPMTALTRTFGHLTRILALTTARNVPRNARVVADPLQEIVTAFSLTGFLLVEAFIAAGEPIRFLVDAFTQ